ncbi:MAG: HPF/RaiA family ribosome-associated protein [Bilophila wadsworthia]
MHISFTFKNFEPSEHLRKYARRRMEKLGRFFGKNPALDAQVNMAVDKFRQRGSSAYGDGINIAASEVSKICMPPSTSLF